MPSYIEKVNPLVLVQPVNARVIASPAEMSEPEFVKVKAIPCAEVTVAGVADPLIMYVRTVPVAFVISILRLLYASVLLDTLSTVTTNPLFVALEDNPTLFAVPGE